MQVTEEEDREDSSTKQPLPVTFRVMLEATEGEVAEEEREGEREGKVEVS
jgi:hypothetical protein